MDSPVAAAWARAEAGYEEIHALAVDYGQRHRAEIQCARLLAKALALDSFRVVSVDLAALGGSALTGDLEVPKGRREADIGREIPVTYVPARNTVLLAIALAAAEVLGAEAIVIGVNAVDYSGYPDCRPAFLEAFRQVARRGTKCGVEGHPIRILAPLLHLTKGAIVRLGLALGVPFDRTLSCYDPVEQSGRWLACGTCDACVLRARGFAEAGVTDPAARA
ncbi:MAG: 7-cyano-7-deazaguanine synthase QueC [Planctomycetota bacterium]